MVGKATVAITICLIIVAIVSVGYGVLKPSSTVTKTYTVTLRTTKTETRTVTETVISPLTTTITSKETYTITLTSTYTLPPITVTTTEVRTNTVTETETTTETIVVTTTVTETPSLSITRSFDIHLVRESMWVRVSVEIPPTLVETYLGCRVSVYVGEEEETYSILVDEAVKQAPIFNLALNLWNLAGGDLELYGAYLLQVVNQMTYNYSKVYIEYGGVQPPITTLIENSGVCGDYALLYASLLKAVNVSFVIIKAKVWSYETNIINGSHVMIGVKLSKPPSLPQQYHNHFLSMGYVGNYSITVDDEVYYIVDPTPPGYTLIEEPKGQLAPPTAYYPAFIGEHIWDKIEIVEIYQVKD